jgi:enoyl-CoA hydratase
LLVDKDNQPRWTPATPEQISDADVEAFFEPLPEDEAWTPYPVETPA